MVISGRCVLFSELLAVRNGNVTTLLPSPELVKWLLKGTNSYHLPLLGDTLNWTFKSFCLCSEYRVSKSLIRDTAL